jgi:subtilase family serine protease
MTTQKKFAIQCTALFTLLSISALQAFAQNNDVQPRITQAVDETKLTLLKGNTFPLARSEYDQGAAPPSQMMETMMLGLKRSPQQEAALEKLMAEQMDKSSPSFHKWLTPVEFGKQFGPSDQDIKVVTSWLESQGFQSVEVANGRTVIEFDGNVGQVQAAFHTVIHNYLVNGKEHYANATDPSIPTALTPVVTGVASLHNFHKKPMYRVARSRASAINGSPSPSYTFADGCDVENGNNDNNCYGLGPTDFAIIYDVTPLWNAGVDGTGQNIAIIGQSDVDMKDISSFRSVFGLPANAPVKVLAGTDPGIQEASGDETESDLDLEWAGAVAKGATLQFVVSQSVDTSAQYAVDHTPLVATVLSESYGLCELQIGTTENGIINSRWQQAATEGITAVIATGDAGSAACDITPGNATPPNPVVAAQNGLQVSGLASTPYNVAVGGTDFNDFTNPGTYWNSTNAPGTLASAKSYIPEITWNSTCSSTQLLQGGATEESDCNDTADFGSIQWTVAGSGGVSNCTTSDGETPGSCAGGYAKPSWQVATGVPSDGKRDIPDVSLFAGNGFNGNFYMVCAADQTGGNYCNANNFNDFYPLGGTSGSTPAFAAIMALVNQKTASAGGQGNANMVLYPMASSQPGAFHDVTTGTIAVLCTGGSPNCNKTVSSDTYGILTGYNAAPGYDLATGLGSVDAANLVNNWGADSTSPNFNLSFSDSAITISSPGGSGSTSVLVNATNGFSGTVTFSCSNLPTESSCGFSPTSVTASGSTTVTITTTAPSMLTPSRRPTAFNAGPKAFELCLVAIGMLWMFIQVKRCRWSSLATALAVFCLLGAAACGGGGSGGSSGGTTPVQNQQVTITATDGTTTHSATLSVTVN